MIGNHDVQVYLTRFVRLLFLEVLRKSVWKSVVTCPLEFRSGKIWNGQPSRYISRGGGVLSYERGVLGTFLMCFKNNPRLFLVLPISSRRFRFYLVRF